MTRTAIFLFGCFASLAFYGACNVNTSALPDAGDIDAGDIGRIEICAGMTLDELSRARTVSDECKALLESYLPRPADNFSDRLMVLGSEERSDGSLRVFIAGADTGGAALDADAFASATVSISDGNGGFVAAQGSFTVTLVADVPDDFMSIGIVNDYSGSMSLADLGVVERIETDLFTVLPPVYEGEVTLFSTNVSVKQAFTSDESSLLEAVVRDTSFERDLTALYDGMGTGLDSLVERTRPIRILLVSTDGLENSSKMHTKAEIIETVSNEGIPVIMLGALFADVPELRALAGPRGVFFYTPLYADLRAEMNRVLDALANTVVVDIAAEDAAERPLRIEVGGTSVEIE